MNWIEVAGWAALALNVWGNWELTKKNVWGWPIRIACNLAWIGYAAPVEAWPLLGNHLLFLGINIVGWRRWTSDNREDDRP